MKLSEQELGQRVLSVITSCAGCGAATRETSEGPVEVGAETVAWAKQVGKTVDLRSGPPKVPPLAPGESPTRHIPLEVARFVAGRDGGRCVVPACGNRGEVEFEHLDGYEQGHVPERMRCVCRAHHRQRHLGFLIARQEADGLHFYLPDGTHLGREGERTVRERPGTRALRDADESPRDEVGLELAEEVREPSALSPPS